MNWNNLLKNTCPKCEYRLSESTSLNPLYPNVSAGVFRCENPECGFRIGKRRMEELVDEIKLKLAESGEGDVMCEECRIEKARLGRNICETCEALESHYY